MEKTWPKEAFRIVRMASFIHFCAYFPPVVLVADSWVDHSNSVPSGVASVDFDGPIYPVARRRCLIVQHVAGDHGASRITHGPSGREDSSMSVCPHENLKRQTKSPTHERQSFVPFSSCPGLCRPPTHHRPSSLSPRTSAHSHTLSKTRSSRWPSMVHRHDAAGSTPALVIFVDTNPEAWFSRLSDQACCFHLN